MVASIFEGADAESAIIDPSKNLSTHQYWKVQSKILSPKIEYELPLKKYLLHCTQLQTIQKCIELHPLQEWAAS